jgi:hypothetical protein
MSVALPNASSESREKSTAHKTRLNGMMFSNPGVGCQVSASALPVDDLCLLITAHGSLRSRRRQ